MAHAPKSTSLYWARTLLLEHHLHFKTIIHSSKPMVTSFNSDNRTPSHAHDVGLWSLSQARSLLRGRDSSLQSSPSYLTPHNRAFGHMIQSALKPSRLDQTMLDLFEHDRSMLPKHD